MHLISTKELRRLHLLDVGKGYKVYNIDPQDPEDRRALRKGGAIQDPQMSAAKKGLHTMFDLDWAQLYGREIDEAPPHGGAFTTSQVKRAPTQPRGGVRVRP